MSNLDLPPQMRPMTLPEFNAPAPDRTMYKHRARGGEPPFYGWSQVPFSDPGIIIADEYDLDKYEFCVPITTEDYLALLERMHKAEAALAESKADYSQAVS